MASRLNLIRNAMKQINIQAYIIPSSDAHMSEYICDADKQMEVISNFHGSNGTLVITEKEAALWTDSRYYLQAGKQLDADYWKLMKDGEPATPSIVDWITEQLSEGETVGIEGKKNSYSRANLWRNQLKEKEKKIQLKSLGEEIIAAGWSDRPEYPKNKILYHKLEYSGEGISSKLQKIHEQFAKKKVAAAVIPALDEIAWVLNVRGSDISFNPVVISYLIISKDTLFWFVDKAKVNAEDPEFKSHFQSIPIEIHEYSEFFPFLDKFVANLPENHKIWIDGSSCSFDIIEKIPENKRVLDHSPISIPKAIKNATEIEGFRKSSLRDSVALVEFFSWLHHHILAGAKITEYEAAVKLHEFRSTRELFVSESFETISSTGPNGSIVHYKPDPETSSLISPDALYLCDSGAQYLDGTTDITRTLHFKSPSDYERRCFTRVLQGHINVARATFPEGTSAGRLDSLARFPLWQDGLDYGHGTGHGFGSFLNVHEPPTLMSSSERSTGPYFTNPLQAGMTVTIEPGYYEDNKFGIRIENDVIVKANPIPNPTNKPFFAFEIFTLVPIQSNLIDANLLDDAQLTWINNYNLTCKNALSPLISDETVLLYLDSITTPLEKQKV